MHVLAGELNMVVTKDGNESDFSFTISQSKEKFQHLGDMVVAEGSSDQEFDFTTYGITSIEELWIISDQEVTIKIDADSNFGIVTKKLILSEADLSSVFISNDSGSDATIQMLIAG